MIRRHMPLQVEVVEQRFPRHRPLAIIGPSPPYAQTESKPQHDFKAEFFNKIDPIADSGPYAHDAAVTDRAFPPWLWAMLAGVIIRDED